MADIQTKVVVSPAQAQQLKQEWEAKGNYSVEITPFRNYQVVKIREITPLVEQMKAEMPSIPSGAKERIESLSYRPPEPEPEPVIVSEPTVKTKKEIFEQQLTRLSTVPKIELSPIAKEQKPIAETIIGKEAKTPSFVPSETVASLDVVWRKTVDSLSGMDAQRIYEKYPEEEGYVYTTSKFGDKTILSVFRDTKRIVTATVQPQAEVDVLRLLKEKGVDTTTERVEKPKADEEPVAMAITGKSLLDLKEPTLSLAEFKSVIGDTPMGKRLIEGIEKREKTKFESMLSAIPETPYKTAEGKIYRSPQEALEYQQAYEDISQKQQQLKENTQAILKNIRDAETNINALQKNYKTISEAPEDSMWQISGYAEPVDKETALQEIQRSIYINEKAIAQKTNIYELEEQYKKLEQQKDLLQEYQKKGYEIDETAGGYSFALPSAYEAHVGLFGKEKTDIMLTSSAFIKSPLAIGTIGSAIQSAITGDKKVQEAEQEALAQYSFGLQESLGEGPVAYVGKVATGGAVVTGIVVPLATMGLGYGISGLQAGATGLSTAGTLAKVGASTVGKGLLLLGKGVPIGIGAGAGITAVGAVSQLATEQPERLGAVLAEIGFGAGMAIAGFKAGQRLYEARIPPPPRDILGKVTVVEEQLGGKKIGFEARGQELVSAGKGKPPTKVDVYMRGTAEPSPFGKDLQITEGVGTVTYTTKPSLIGRLFGRPDVTRTQVFSLGGEARPLIQSPQQALSVARGTTQPMAGQTWGATAPQYGPTISKGLAITKQLEALDFKASQFPVLPSGTTQSQLYYMGVYKTPVGVTGKAIQFGDVFRLPSAQAGAGAGGIGGSGISIDLGTGTIAVQQTGILSAVAPSIAGVVGTAVPVTLTTTIPFISPAIGLAGGAVGAVQAQVVKPKVREVPAVQALQQPIAQVQEAPTLTMLLPEVTGEVGVEGIVSPKIGYQPMVQPVVEPTQEPEVGEPYAPPVQEFVQDLLPQQEQEQQQELIQQQLLETVTVTPIIGITEVVPPPPISWTVPYPFPIVSEEEQEQKRKKKKKEEEEKKKRKLKKIKKPKKEFLADIASVTKSQALFGTATHPALTPEQWRRAEQTGFVVVPTVELQEEERGKRGTRASPRELIGINDKKLNLGIGKKKKGKNDINMWKGG